MKYVCPGCKTFFKILRNGAKVLERFPETTAEGIKWKPYKLFLADLYECRACYRNMAVTAHHPYSEHFMNGFAAELTAAQASPYFIDSEDC